MGKKRLLYENAREWKTSKLFITSSIWIIPRAELVKHSGCLPTSTWGLLCFNLWQKPSHDVKHMWSYSIKKCSESSYIRILATVPLITGGRYHKVRTRLHNGTDCLNKQYTVSASSELPISSKLPRLRVRLRELLRYGSVLLSKTVETGQEAIWHKMFRLTLCRLLKLSYLIIC